MRATRAAREFETQFLARRARAAKPRKMRVEKRKQTKAQQTRHCTLARDSAGTHRQSAKRERRQSGRALFERGGGLQRTRGGCSEAHLDFPDSGGPFVRGDSGRLRAIKMESIPPLSSNSRQPSGSVSRPVRVKFAERHLCCLSDDHGTCKCHTSHRVGERWRRDPMSQARFVAMMILCVLISFCRLGSAV